MSQTQTPALRAQSEGDQIDYTPVAAVYAGDIVLVGTVPLLADVDIAAAAKGALSCEGVWQVPKDTSTFSAGDAVYWNPTGSPVTGTVSTGAATSTASGAYLMGFATADAATGVSYVYTKATAAKRTMTADDITGSDSSLSISGLAGNASAGGTVALVGGAAAAGAYNGGAVTITGGAGPTAGNVGGALTLLSGAGDASNGTAGAVLIDSSGTGATKGAITIGTNAASISFGKQPRMPQATVNANGGNIATAAALTAGTTVVAGSDNSKGVQLPSCAAGVKCVVVNQNTDKTLKVYPPLGKTIGAVGANNAITLVANAIGVFESYDTNTYYAGVMPGIVS